MLQHTSAPVVQAAPAVSPLGVVDIASICDLLGVSRSWLENTIRQDETFPRPFKIRARRLVKFADLQAWVSRRHARLSTVSSSSALASTRGGRSATVGFRLSRFAGRSCPRCSLKRSGSGGLFIQGCSPTTRPPASTTGGLFWTPQWTRQKHPPNNANCKSAGGQSSSTSRKPLACNSSGDTVDTNHECSFVTYSLCDLLRYRFDCPDCALDALDELRKLQGHPNAREEIEALGVRTRAALRRRHRRRRAPADAAPQLSGANMPKRKRLSPTLRRVLLIQFPDMPLKEALRLIEMGILRMPKNLRCGAYARSTGKPCKAQAIPGGYRCKNHGGAPKSETGRQNIIEGQRRRWERWRAELAPLEAIRPPSPQRSTRPRRRPWLRGLGSRPRGASNVPPHVLDLDDCLIRRRVHHDALPTIIVGELKPQAIAGIQIRNGIAIVPSLRCEIQMNSRFYNRALHVDMPIHFRLRRLTFSSCST